MTLTELLSSLPQVRKLVVTGPQRSGTTIAGKILAKELDLPYVDEKAIGFHKWPRFLQVETGVIQAPGLFHRIQEMACPKVVMIRDLDDIQASEKRIRWRAAGEWAHFERQDKPISQVKYEFWDKVKEGLSDWYELEYESLSTHEMWVPKEFRKQFKPKQTVSWTELWAK